MQPSGAATVMISLPPPPPERLSGDLQMLTQGARSVSSDTETFERCRRLAATKNYVSKPPELHALGGAQNGLTVAIGVQWVPT